MSKKLFLPVPPLPHYEVGWSPDILFLFSNKHPEGINFSLIWPRPDSSIISIFFLPLAHFGNWPFKCRSIREKRHLCKKRAVHVQRTLMLILKAQILAERGKERERRKEWKIQENWMRKEEKIIEECVESSLMTRCVCGASNRNRYPPASSSSRRSICHLIIIWPLMCSSSRTYIIFLKYIEYSIVGARLLIALTNRKRKKNWKQKSRRWRLPNIQTKPFTYFLFQRPPSFPLIHTLLPPCFISNRRRINPCTQVHPRTCW